MTKKLILRANLCPGDILTMTAAVESLHLTYPGEYQTDVRTPSPEIWQHNPRIIKVEDDDPQAEKIDLHYPSINRSNQEHIPFLGGYTDDLARKIDRPLTLKVNRPCLYLSDDEKTWIDQVRHHFTDGRKVPFWLVNAGIKSDYTAKAWPVEYYQEVVSRTLGRIQWVQVGAKEHDHPTLDGAISLVGKTDHRQLIRLVWHARGGLGPVTYLQHLCAAWEKPYICLLGGREPVTWTQYPLQHTLHTIGMFSCCQTSACWKSRIVPAGDSSSKDQSLCQWPVIGLARPVARCMAAIRPDEVIALLERILVCQQNAQ
jgi:ADP-heptose:LPS heptosyltransferase